MCKWQIRHLLAFGLLFLALGCEQKKQQKLISETTQGESGVDSHYEELKNLSWLVGDWKDDDKDLDISYSTEWSNNHNFIIQHFNAQLEDEGDIVEGEQIIGWDPAEKKVRSWVFDSDGGFGESTWTQDGSVWYSTMKFTMPEGGKASATHVYTKLDDRSYTFASTNRDVDGEVLPDIGPFKIIKTK